jgi:hypothetical protein
MSSAIMMKLEINNKGYRQSILLLDLYDYSFDKLLSGDNVLFNELLKIQFNEIV